MSAPKNIAIAPDKLMAACHSSYVQGGHDFADSMIDAINSAQEHALTTADVAQALRSFVEAARRSLPPKTRIDDALGVPRGA